MRGAGRGCATRRSRPGKSFVLWVTSTAPCARAVPATGASGVSIVRHLRAHVEHRVLDRFPPPQPLDEDGAISQEVRQRSAPASRRTHPFLDRLRVSRMGIVRVLEQRSRPVTGHGRQTRAAAMREMSPATASNVRRTLTELGPSGRHSCADTCHLPPGRSGVSAPRRWRPQMLPSSVPPTSPSHDQRGIRRPSGTSSAERW
jgi:hypothetical protein